MLGLAIGALALSALMAFVIGHAVIAERDSFLRTKFGITLLVVGALSFIPLPPQLTSLEGALQSMPAGLEALTSGLAWPAAIGKGTYLVVWIVTTIAAAAVGAQLWRAGKPGWRPGANSAAYDTSASGRARGLLPMADSLDDALDTLARSGVDAKGVDLLATDIRAVGRRFSASLPQDSSALYRMVVTALPTGGLAPGVTRYLLEGAEREVRV